MFRVFCIEFPKYDKLKAQKQRTEKYTTAVEVHYLHDEAGG